MHISGSVPFGLVFLLETIGKLHYLSSPSPNFRKNENYRMSREYRLHITLKIRECSVLWVAAHRPLPPRAAMGGRLQAIWVDLHA